MASDLARLVAPHVIGAVDVIHLLDGGDPTELHAPTVTSGGVHEDVAYRCGRDGVHVTRSAHGKGRVPWPEIVALVLAGLTPTNGAAVREAHAAEMAALLAHHAHEDTHPWYLRRKNADDAADIESRRLARAAGDAARVRAAAVAGVIAGESEPDMVTGAGQLVLDLTAWLDRKALVTS